VIYHLGSPEEIRMVELRDVKLGSCEWSRFNTFLLNSNVQDYDGVEGIAGVKALGFKIIQFNFETQKVSWSNNRAPAESAHM
jgi:hypothetical protein